MTSKQCRGEQVHWAVALGGKVGLALLLVLLALSAVRAGLGTEGVAHSIQMVRNPAAVYCAEVMGYEYRTATDPGGGERGVCVMPDGQECGQWDFYAGQCGQEYSYCARHGYRVETRNDGQDPFSPEYGVCVTSGGRVLGPVSRLARLNPVYEVPLPYSPDGEAAGGEPLTATYDQALPPSFDWRDYEGGDWLTEVKDQQLCGSCWAFAAVGVTEAHQNILAGNPALDPDLSEQELVSCSSAGTCAGGSATSALRYIRDHGIVDELCFTYVFTDAPCTRCADWESRLTYVDAVMAGVPSRSWIKQSVVNYGPLYVSMGIGADYGGHFDGDNIYRCSNDWENGHNGSNHAVVIVGYDDPGQYWIVRNSWDKNWGDGGYFNVAYDECNIDRTWGAYVFAINHNVFLPLTGRNFSPAAVCTAGWTLTCGGSDTWNNGYSGATDNIDYYPCVGWNETGPEYAYSFTPGSSTQVTVTLSNMTADLDVFVLDGSSGRCSSSACIAYGNTTTSFEASAGRTYYIVVDGYYGSVGSYTVNVSCATTAPGQERVRGR